MKPDQTQITIQRIEKFKKEFPEVYQSLKPGIDEILARNTIQYFIAEEALLHHKN
jgi:hypothetical protein